MKSLRLAILALTLSLSTGCWMLEPQTVTLSEQTQTALEAQFGDDLEAMRQQLSEQLRADVDAVVRTETGKLEAVLKPPFQEAAEEGAESFVGKIASSPTVQDAIAGAFLAILSGLGVMKVRSKLRERNGKARKK